MASEHDPEQGRNWRLSRVKGASWCAAFLFVAGVVSLVVTGYRADDPDLSISAWERITPWALFSAGLAGTAVCGVLLRAGRRGSTASRWALWITVGAAAVVVASVSVWAATSA